MNLETQCVFCSRVSSHPSSAIYWPPQANEEQEDMTTPFGVPKNLELGRRSLRRAYETGGISLCGQIALRELEAEARLEREGRNQVKHMVSVTNPPSFYMLAELS